MRAVWKFSLLGPNPGGTQLINMPSGAMLMKVGMQAQGPVFWALVDPEQPVVSRTFMIVGTGHPTDRLDSGTFRYVGTFEELDGALVWHLFEVECG